MARRLLYFILLIPFSLIVSIVEYLEVREPLAWAFYEAWDHTKRTPTRPDMDHALVNW